MWSLDWFHCLRTVDNLSDLFTPFRCLQCPKSILIEWCNMYRIHKTVLSRTFIRYKTIVSWWLRLMRFVTMLAPWPDPAIAPEDKVEIIVLGGTWSHYPRDYQAHKLGQGSRSRSSFWSSGDHVHSSDDDHNSHHNLPKLITDCSEFFHHDLEFCLDHCCEFLASTWDSWALNPPGLIGVYGDRWEVLPIGGKWWRGKRTWGNQAPVV